jgi:hypothetical protein
LGLQSDTVSGPAPRYTSPKITLRIRRALLWPIIREAIAAAESTGWKPVTEIQYSPDPKGLPPESALTGTSTGESHIAHLSAVGVQLCSCRRYRCSRYWPYLGEGRPYQLLLSAKAPISHSHIIAIRHDKHAASGVPRYHGRIGTAVPFAGPAPEKLVKVDRLDTQSAACTCIPYRESCGHRYGYVITPARQGRYWASCDQKARAVSGRRLPRRRVNRKAPANTEDS